MSRPHRTEPLAAVDAAWLRMDGPTNPMVITALLTFEAAPAYSGLVDLIRRRLLAHPRFSQRVVEPPLGSPRWEADPHFDVEAHLHHVALPAPGGQRELESLAGDLASTPLDRAKPLWQAHWVEGYAGGAALLVRLHHCMGDGVALVRFFLGLTDEGALLGPPEVGVEAPEAHGVIEHARLAAAQVSTLGRLLLLPSDSRNALRGELGRSKRTAWSAPIPLERLKAIAHALDAKVNDVLMGALAGALGAYLQSHGDAPSQIRALTPMYVKVREERGGLGNHFGLVYVDLPLSLGDPLQRIGELKRRIDTIKAQPDAVVSLGVLAAMGVASAELEHIGVELFTKKASVMITNVPGPPLPVHLAGSEVTDLMVWAPVSGHIGVGLSLLSYAGHARLGVAADARIMPRPSELAVLFVTEIERAHSSVLALAR